MSTVFSLRVSRKIRDFMATLSEEERGQFTRILELIRQDPAIDAHYKIYFPMPPAVFTLYHDGAFSILYHVTIDTIHVFQAQRGPYLPPPSEFER